ncbi:hypothetical protein [Cohnella caldifontis]|uniref:hypothetical protein n=1 Tax=Cohnella caldifontis TaxID=3027471 RepID=UPI0023EB3962|nr:hypothetical protein [Cohnella sp. YIM B05605]
MERAAIREWNDRLRQCREDLGRKAKLERRLNHLDVELSDRRWTAEECRQRLDKERKEEEKLAASSFAQFWHGLFGDWEERLSKERKEAAEAKLKYDAALALLERLETDREQTKRELAEVAGADAELTRIMELKEEWIREFDPDTAQRLEAIAGQAAEAQRLLKEIREAEAAGEDARQALRQAEDRLGSAGDWGVYDLLGGGMISTMIKHGRIDEAREHIHDAQHHLRRFARELQDVNMGFGAGGPEIGGFLSFADYFFDGLIADWMVQGRIRDSIDSVHAHQGKLNEAMRALSGRRSEQERETARLEEEYGKLLEQYGG